jgi:hypothetical protein
VRSGYINNPPTQLHPIFSLKLHMCQGSSNTGSLANHLIRAGQYTLFYYTPVLMHGPVWVFTSVYNVFSMFGLLSVIHNSGVTQAAYHTKPCPSRREQLLNHGFTHFLAIHSEVCMVKRMQKDVGENDTAFHKPSTITLLVCVLYSLIVCLSH